MGAGGLSWLASMGNVGAQPRASLTSAVWRAWFDELEKMQAQVRRRGWDLVPLRVDLPASEAEIARVEARHGMAVPPQLREILLYWSAGVGFGWSIPSLYRPLEKLDLPVSGGLRDRIWSLDHIDGDAIQAFKDLRDSLAGDGDGEEPNRPEMWENQFAIASLDNGDVLTIDVSVPDGAQPVRYFSSDREGLHHHVIAPDFIAFVTAYTRLGCAGGDQDDWFRFIAPGSGELSLLDSDGEGARRWRAWLERDPRQRDPDEPPVPVPAKTRSDFDLLDAARDGSAWGVEVALAAGAVPDCVAGDTPKPEGYSDITFVTALVYAVRRGDLKMVQRLLAAGASIDTRLLSVSEAIRSNHVDVVRWLLAHGARANGWRGERYWPLHVLLTQTRASWHGGDADTLAMLEALLAAGADPDARWDGDRTMLMWTGAKAIKILLEHGADPNLYDHEGDTALHLAKSAEAVRLLVAHGADVDALTRRPPSPLRGERHGPPHTPYQAHLASVGREPNAREILDALAAAGANVLKRDGRGRSTLWYCRSVDDARRLIALGLDPHEFGPNGGTLLHETLLTNWNGLVSDAAARDLFAYYQGLGLDINAATRDGDTVLHWAAQWGSKEVVALLLRLGADKTRRDGKGRLPVDRVPASKPELRDLLRV